MKYYDGDSFIAVSPYIDMTAQPSAHIMAWRAHRAKCQLGARYCLHNSAQRQATVTPIKAKGGK